MLKSVKKTMPLITGSKSRKARKSHNTKSAHILNNSTPFVITEAYKTARTNIIYSFSNSEKGCKKIAIISGNQGEGKTTSALNLAIAFAQTGARVLIIDSDMRKPRMHSYLGTDRKTGLSTILVGGQTWEETVKCGIRENLDFIPAGPIPPNPAELMASSSMEDLLNALSEHYDYIFIDTPPVNLVTDATTISKFVNGYIFVVRHMSTMHESISQTLELLQITGARLLGFFVNDVKSQELGYGAYKKKYGYKYNYKYGYKYGSTPETEQLDRK